MRYADCQEKLLTIIVWPLPCRWMVFPRRHKKMRKYLTTPNKSNSDRVNRGVQWISMAVRSVQDKAWLMFLWTVFPSSLAFHLWLALLSSFFLKNFPLYCWILFSFSLNIPKERAINGKTQRPGNTSWTWKGEYWLRPGRHNGLFNSRINNEDRVWSGWDC